MGPCVLSTCQITSPGYGGERLSTRCAYLGGEDGSDGLVPHVDESDVLHNQWKQCLHCTRSQTMKDTSGNMAHQRRAATSPEARQPGQRGSQKQDGPATDGSGKRHEEIGGDTIAQHGDRGQKCNVRQRDGRVSGRDKRQGIRVVLHVGGLEDGRRVHARVLEEEDGRQAGDGDLGSQGDRANWERR